MSEQKYKVRLTDEAITRWVISVYSTTSLENMAGIFTQEQADELVKHFEAKDAVAVPVTVRDNVEFG